jgi:hypothetical protein
MVSGVALNTCLRYSSKSFIVIPAQAGIHWAVPLQQEPVQGNRPWITACARMMASQTEISQQALRRFRAPPLKAAQTLAIRKRSLHNTDHANAAQ